jgi:hypothetical protein
MPDYRRAFDPGGACFYTVITLDRRPILASDFVKFIITWYRKALVNAIHLVWVLRKIEFDQKEIIKMKYTIVFLILLVPLKSVFSNDNYFPLEVGNYWRYITPDPFMLSSPKVTTESVIRTDDLGEEQFFVFDHYRLNENVLCRQSNDQVYVLLDTTQYLLYDFSADIGDKWIAPDPPHSFYGYVTLRSKTDTVQTDLGTVYNCYHFRHYLRQDYIYDEWFAPNLGLVRRDTNLLGALYSSTLIESNANTDIELAPPVSRSLLQLYQNYPNPFNPQTTISFELSIPAEVTISIYNLNGQLVSELFRGKKQTGVHYLTWNASDNSTGLYFIEMIADDFIQIRKCYFLK